VPQDPASHQPSEPGPPQLSKLAQWTAPAAFRLAKIPKPVLLIGIAALLVGGLVLENAIGGVLLVLLGLFFGWLLMLAWPALTPSGRIVRLVVVGLIVYLAVRAFQGK
jgi:hypothetical protein